MLQNNVKSLIIFSICLGIDEVDFTLYPDKKFQVEWLQVYLTAWHLYNYGQEQEQNEELEAEVERLYKQVNKFSLVSVLEV